MRKIKRNIIIRTDNQGKIIDFVAKPDAYINDAVRDVVKYLFFNNIEKEYVLHFNDIELIISSRSTVQNVVDEYLNSASI